ncbi:porin family protein [Halocynthiibacter sp. C4]|uniref:porin family protein n=1 Tax=Halocynthiibacter sp. C4 TaxID=2992758 RepID=UPI00237AF3D2|nr:porin family protein [Halocynthiibacter sp. C4]MDE0589933.1 porin family protein [Halocynthiibacter sp. C4]
MKNKFALGAAVLAMSTSSALAQDWSGFYAGGGIGNLSIDTSLDGVDGNSTTLGVHAGYRFDLGEAVLGGEFEYDAADVELVPGAVTADSVMRLKVTAGYDLGSTLLYVAAGSAQVNVDGVGDEWGGFLGLGAAYEIAPQTVIGLEVLQHEFKDIAGSGIDADATSVGLRASWRF